MQTRFVWHSQYLHRIQKLIFCLLLLSASTQLLAQRNVLEHYNRRFYFGITLGTNFSNFKVVHSEAFTFSDSIMAVNSSRGPGFNLGIISNMRLNEYFDLRFIPALVFGDKKILFTEPSGNEVTKTIESIYTEFPVQVRFKSQPWKDMKLYVFTGLKYSLDLASNSKTRNAFDQIKVRRGNFDYEYGLGLQFFFPLFIFSPEIKFSNGIRNMHVPNNNLIYSNMIDRLQIRTITVSIHFEG
jgi:hypothetical protein